MTRRRRSRSRALHIERLSRRELLASDLQNRYEPLDVNEDLRVSAMDVLWVINRLAIEGDPGSAGGMPDVDGNGEVTSLDALKIINALGNDDPISIIRLVNDTGPGGMPNNDGLTSDLTLEGRIQWPESTPAGLRVPHLATRLSSGSYQYQSLVDYLDGDYFHLPADDVTPWIRSAADPETLELRLELHDLRVTFASPAAPLAQIVVRFDPKHPEFVLPAWISQDADSVRIDIFDDSPVQGIGRDPSASDALKFFIDDQSIPLHWQSTSGIQAIDLAVGQVAGGAADVVRIDADAVIEDLAGNRTNLPKQFVVQRGKSSAALGFLPSGPIDGTAFFDDGVTANPNQLIRLPILQGFKSQTITVTKVHLVDDEGDRVFAPGPHDAKLSRTSLLPLHEDFIGGEAIYQLPLDVTSGPIRDRYGQVIAQLHVVPKTPQVRVSDGVWELPSYPGGLHPDELLYRYRFPAGDQLNSSDFVPDDVAQWPAIVAGEPAPKFGLQPIQLAGEGGVGEPFDLGFAHPNLGTIWSVLSDVDDQHLWLGLDERLVKIDAETADVVDEIEFTRSGGDIESDIFPEAVSSVRDLQWIAADRLASAVEFLDGQPADTSGSWMVGFLGGPNATVVIDPSDGRVLGSLPYRGSDLHDEFLGGVDGIAPVYHPELESWFSVSHDGRYLREFSIDDGQQTREELAIGGHLWPSNSRGSLSGLLEWDPVRQQMVLFRGRETYVFDEASYSLSRASGYLNRDNYANDQSNSDVAIDNQGDLLFSRSSGIVVKIPIVPDTLAEIPVVNEIVSVAQTGEPADPDVASANPGQLIEVRGENLDAKGFRLEFPSQSLVGIGRTARYEGLRTEAPLHVSDDGTTAWLSVPNYAVTGSVTVQDQVDAIGLALQIVPATVSGVEGLGIDDFQLRLDGQLVNHCLDPGSSRVCGTLLSKEVLPIARETIQYVTAGGSVTRWLAEASPSHGDTWEMRSLVSASPYSGADFQFDLPAESWVAGGSEVVFEIVAKDGVEEQDRPDWLAVHFVSRSTDHVPRHQRVVAKKLEESEQYSVWMPPDFPGGELVVEGAHAGDASLDIEVAPTVVAASGDSALGGSALLVAGVGLRGADFFIDDLSVSFTDLSSWDEYAWDLLRLEVPENVTAGVLRVEREGASAVLQRLQPWWLPGEMPTAMTGTPTFADLPSINLGQAFQFRAAASSDDFRLQHFDGQLFARTIKSGDINEVTELDEQHILAEVAPSTAQSVYIFRERNSSLWNIVPVLPDQADLTEIRYDDSADVGLVGFDSTSVYAMDHVNIDWGDQSWRADKSRTYRDTYTIDSGRRVYSSHYENALQAPQSSLPSSYGLEIESTNRSDIDVLFDRAVFPTLPSGAIQFRSPWGTVPTGTVADDDQAVLDDFAQQLSAERGTPADPNLPSVNADQLIELPADVASRFSAAYFSTSDDARGDGNDPAWLGTVVQSEPKIRVPFQTRTGLVRLGLFGTDLPLQVVPTVSVFEYSIVDRDGILLQMTGIDAQSVLRIGEKEFSLSIDEVSDLRVYVSILDPRFQGLTRDDFASGIQVTSLGGVSETVYPKMIRRIIPPTPSLFPAQDPSIPAVAGGQVVRVEGFHLEEDETVFFGDFFSLSNDLVDVSPDGRSAQLVIARPSDRTENKIQSLRYIEASYWALESIPVQVFVTPDVQFGPIDMVAFNGQPVDPSKPSANAGQYISFEVTPGSQWQGKAEYPVWNTETNQLETYTRSTFSVTGLPQVRGLWLLRGTGPRVPVSGDIMLEGLDVRFEYQLVPTLWDIQRVTAHKIDVTLRGAHAGNAELFWDDQLVYSYDPAATLSDQIQATWVDARTVQLLFAEGASTSGTLRVRTDGGSHQRAYE